MTTKPLPRRTPGEALRRAQFAHGASWPDTPTAAERARAVFGPHHSRGGHCAAGCPGLWPCSAAMQAVEAMEAAG